MKSDTKLKFRLTRKINNGKATDDDIMHWLELNEYIVSLERFKESLKYFDSIKEARGYFVHCSKYGGSEIVTFEKYINIRGVNSIHRIAENYGFEYKIERPNVYDPVYISERENCSIIEAEKFIEQYKADKATSKSNFIKKYGEERGMELYTEWFEKSLQKGWDERDKNGPAQSRRSIEYYTKRGMSVEEATKEVSKYQRENSGIHIEYYIKRGKSLTYARKKIRSYYDKMVGVDSFRYHHEKAGILSDEEIDILVKKAKDSWTDLSDNNKEAKLKKTRKTFEELGIWIPLEDLSDYDLYRRTVWEYTNKNNLKDMKNYEKRGLSGTDGAYQLDHKYSISRGYMDGISPELIGSYANLKFIPWRENNTKQGKCSITEEELINENQKN